MPDPVLQFFLKHLLVFMTKRHDPRTLLPVEAAQLAVPDEDFLRALAVKSDVVIHEEAHALDHVWLLGNLALVLEEGLHDRLHDVE